MLYKCYIHYLVQLYIIAFCLKMYNILIENVSCILYLSVRLFRSKSDLRKNHDDAHFAMASSKYVHQLAAVFGKKYNFCLSQDDKAHVVPIGLPADLEEDNMPMHLEYKVQLPDHDFSISISQKLSPPFILAVSRKKVA